jgi:hypothetical protein
MTNENPIYITYLESVGSVINESTLMVYPVLDTKNLEFDEEMGVHLSEVDDSWFYELDEKDSRFIETFENHLNK